MTIVRTLHRSLVYLFAAALVVQFFLAGAGVFRASGPGDAADSGSFDPHRALGGILILVALLVFLSGAIGERRWRLPLLLFALTFLQGFLAIKGWAGGLHPVNGLLIVAVAAKLVYDQRSATSVPSPA
jgi:hypothetical protein